MTDHPLTRENGHGAEAGNPLVSIILLTYNHEKFVAEALDGIFAQTYSPIELVVIDDASSDGTVAVIQAKLASRPDRAAIKFVRQATNQTGEVGCKTGLAMTNGPFVHIAASDDIMLPEMIAEMVAVWQKEGVSLVTANAHYIDVKSNMLGRTFRDPDMQPDESFETLARDGANDCCFGPAIGFERELYDTFGWPPSLFLAAYDIMLPFYAYLDKGARFIARPLLKYRVHAGNTSMSLISERSDEVEQLRLEQRIKNDHLAHAVLFQDKLDELSAQRPDRYAQIAQKMLPLTTIQIIQMAKKLVRIRYQLYEIERRQVGSPTSASGDCRSG